MPVADSAVTVHSGPGKAPIGAPYAVAVAVDDRVRRSLDYAVRAAAFAAFVWFLWSVPYAPHRHDPFGDADTEAAVRAINAGYPFQLMYLNGEHDAPTIRPMSAVYGDYGIPIAAAFVARAGRWLRGPSFQVAPTVGREILLSLFVITAAAMLVPGMPLLAGVAGILALRALFEWGPMTLGPAQHWGVAYAAVVTAVFLGSVVRPWTALRACALAALAALAAATQLVRQEGSIVPTAAAIGLVVIAALAFLARRSTRDVDRSGLRRVALRAAAGGLLLFAANAAVQPIERWTFSRAWGTSYANTSAAAHGSGWPLYLGLGYVSNPFNIAWRDPIGQVHAQLINPNVRYGGADFQNTLLGEYVRIVIERPWLLIRNVAAKAVRLHRLAMRQSDMVPGMAIWQRPAHTRFYVAAWGVLLGCLGLLAWRGTPEAAVVWCGSIALLAGATAGALIVFPDYVGGLQGATVALALVMPASMAGALADRNEPRAASAAASRRILAGWLALAAAGGVAAAAFVGVQRWRYSGIEHAAAAADPLDGIEARQFRYAHVFNDLPVPQQGRLVARLTSSRDPRVARVIDLRRGDLDLFRPEALVRSDAQLHLIAWMGRSFRAPFPALYQGATHAIFFICGECAPESTVDDFPFDSGWTFINDLEWRGRYRMFSVPLNAKLKAARFFHVAAERVVALESSIQSTGLRSALLAGARVSY